MSLLWSAYAQPKIRGDNFKMITYEKLRKEFDEKVEELNLLLIMPKQEIKRLRL